MSCLLVRVETLFLLLTTLTFVPPLHCVPVQKSLAWGTKYIFASLNWLEHGNLFLFSGDL